MIDGKNISGISAHKIRKGVLITPLNATLGDKLNLSSWAKERMPEYLWLGLILLRYGRKMGIDKAGNILFEISRNVEALLQPRMSKIFSLSDDGQKLVYEIICKHVEKDIFAPLTSYIREDFIHYSMIIFSFHIYWLKIVLISSRKQLKVFSPHQSMKPQICDFWHLVYYFLAGSYKL